MKIIALWTIILCTSFVLHSIIVNISDLKKILNDSLWFDVPAFLFFFWGLVSSGIRIFLRISNH